jgi:hypothetical protein
MPPMIVTPVAASQDKEQDFEQEFELDIRVSSVNTSLSQAATANTGGCCGPTHTCATDCGTCTCHTACATRCGCPTIDTGGCCHT